MRVAPIFPPLGIASGRVAGPPLCPQTHTTHCQTTLEDNQHHSKDTLPAHLYHTLWSLQCRSYTILHTLQWCARGKHFCADESCCQTSCASPQGVTGRAARGRRLCGGGWNRWPRRRRRRRTATPRTSPSTSGNGGREKCVCCLFLVRCKIALMGEMVKWQNTSSKSCSADRDVSSWFRGPISFLKTLLGSSPRGLPTRRC